MSFFVKRQNSNGRIAWTGPIRSERQAHREAAAWNGEFGFVAEVIPSSPEVRKQVRAWEKARPGH